MKSIKFVCLGGQLALGIAGLITSGLSTAAQSWNFNTGLTSGGIVTSCGPNTGCPTTLSLGALSTQTITETSSNTSSFNSPGSTTFKSARAYDWGTYGLGVVSTSENPNTTGPHAFDNRFGTDAMVLGFTAAVNLNAVTIGWNGTDNGANGYSDSDFSVFAWVGTGIPTGTDVGPANLTTNGWKLVGNYGDVGSNFGDRQTIDATVTGNTSKALYSSYWLISAYNSNFGFSSQSSSNSAETCAERNSSGKCIKMTQSTSTVDIGTNGGELQTNVVTKTRVCTSNFRNNSCVGGTYGTPTTNLLAFNDEFKLLMLAADPCRSNSVTNNQCNAVPEPSGLALVGLGLVGLLTTRRRLISPGRRTSVLA